MASQACCDSGFPVSVDHVDQGEEISLDGLTVYKSGDPKTAKAGVLLIYDIFGLKHPQLRDVCDRLADAGFYVLMPDIFAGEPFPLDQFPPKDMSVIMEFFGRVDPLTPPAVEKCKAHFREAGLKGKLGVAGFCWGGGVAVKCASDPDFGAAATAHPARVDKALAAAVQCPLALFPAKGDVPDAEEILEELKKKPFGDDCSLKRYDDQIHGFVAARGEWSKPEVKKAADEVVGSIIALFNKALK